MTTIGHINGRLALIFPDAEPLHLGEVSIPLAAKTSSVNKGLHIALSANLEEVRDTIASIFRTTPSASTSQVSLDPTLLTWDRRIPTGKELREWLESLPASEFATGLLQLAEALDRLAGGGTE